MKRAVVGGGEEETHADKVMVRFFDNMQTSALRSSLECPLPDESVEPEHHGRRKQAERQP
jgi:hypothetical protein